MIVKVFHLSPLTLKTTVSYRYCFEYSCSMQQISCCCLLLASIILVWCCRFWLEFGF